MTRIPDRKLPPRLPRTGICCLLTCFLLLLAACSPDTAATISPSPVPSHTATTSASATTSVTDRPASAGDERILYVVFAGGSSDIFVMNADGSGVTRLTTNPAYDNYPAWSPDGTRIVFQSQRDGNDQIYVMGADGSGATRLTQTKPPTASLPGRQTGCRSSFNPTGTETMRSTA